MSFGLDFSFLSQGAKAPGSDTDQQESKAAINAVSEELQLSAKPGENQGSSLFLADRPSEEKSACLGVAVLQSNPSTLEGNDVNHNNVFPLNTHDDQQYSDAYRTRPAGTNFEKAFAHIQVPAHRPVSLPPTQSAMAVSVKVTTHNPRAVLVSRRQAGNPLLKFIRNVPWEHADILADYQMGTQTCALFLSVRFHLLKPKYIYSRMEQLQTGFKLRVLICHIDTEDSQKTLTDIHKAAILNNWTLILSWSPEESARYLETYQTYEHKQADSIQERVEGDYMSRLTDVLTNVRSVNRTDVANLSTSLGSLANIMTASRERLALCPGVGEKKIQRLYEAFREPFRQVKKAKSGST